MNITTLSNGIRIVTEQMEQSRSAAVCVYIGCGSRHEAPEQGGASHFIEHMLFKGTPTRSAAAIAEEMDGMGGQLNAYTTKEYTCVYAQALENHVAAAYEIICDMLTSPLMSPSDMAVERGVILEEISMYEDSPEDYCADLLCESIWGEHSLGANILGTRQTVSALTADDLSRHMERFYVPERMTVSVCGRFPEEEIIALTERYFGGRKNTGNPLHPVTAGFHGGLILRSREFEQSHMILAFEGLPAGDPKRYAAAVFSNIAGGSASSRLNRRIREELGLAYSVYTYNAAYLGAGIFGVGAGVAHENQDVVLGEILKILEELQQQGVDEAELLRTKEQFKAGMVMGLESSSSRASAMGRGILLENHYTDEDTMIERINALTRQDIESIAKTLIDPSRMALTVVGKPLPEERCRELLSRYCR